MKILRKKTAKEKEVSFEVDFERRRISGRLSLLFGDQIACVAGVDFGRALLPRAWSRALLFEQCFVWMTS